VRIIGRLLLMALVLPVAIATGAFALLVAALIDPVLAPLSGALVQAGFHAFAETVFALGDPHADLEAAARFGRLAFALLVLPPAFVALATEIAGARGFLWHVGGTALLTGAVPWLLRSAARVPTPDETHITLVLMAVGALSGFVYWLLAGQWAGRPRSAPPEAAIGAGRARPVATSGSPIGSPPGS
jgi:hypothetical protein